MAKYKLVNPVRFFGDRPTSSIFTFKSSNKSVNIAVRNDTLAKSIVTKALNGKRALLNKQGFPISPRVKFDKEFSSFELFVIKFLTIWY